MTPLELLQKAAGRRFQDEDGNEDGLTLLPPLSPMELAAFEAKLPCPLPPDIRELLGVTRGWAGGPLDAVDLTGLGGFEMDDLFPHSISFAHDGYGNYWLADLLPTSTTWGPIYYACHDPAVIVYQCADLTRFIADVIGMMDPPYKGPIDDVHEGLSIRIWRDNPDAFSVPAAASSPDGAVRAFAASLPPDAMLTDLRRPRLGDGFSWGRFGPEALLFRHEEAALFASAPNPRKRSLWKRLIGSH